MKQILLTLLAVSISVAAVAGLKPGDKAAGFKLKNIDGKTISLDDYLKHDGVILVFSCNTCPVVVAYEDRIIGLDKKFASKGYPVIAINSNDPVQAPGDSYDKMIDRAKEKGFTFPYLYDDTQEVAMAYGATKTPHVYLLTKKKDHFRVAYVGAIDDNQRNPSAVKQAWVEEAIAALKSGTKPATEQTVAVGCSIKYRK
ncbi:MAG: thioredoxin family protein [Bacteroidales bacterium]